MYENTDQRPAGSRLRDALLVAPPLTAGIVLWWWLVPPAVLGGNRPASPGGLAVTAMLILPLATLAVAAGGWLARRRRWPRRAPLRQAGATVGLLALLLLAAAPLHQAVSVRLAPPAPQPNLAAIQYDVSCPSVSTAEECQRLNTALAGFDADRLATVHRSMIDHTGHSAEATAAAAGRFDGTTGLGVDTAAYAVQDALIVLAVALPLMLLALYLVGRLRPATPAATGRHRDAGLTRLRSRWAVVTATVALLVTGNLVFAPVARAQTNVPPPFSMQLRFPPVLQGSEVTIQMREANVQVLPSGPPTRMWTYNGSFPGPTIRRPSGNPSHITFRNNLPVSFGEATIHHHGSHSAPSEDGHPDRQLIPPGGLRTYEYEHFERGAPEWAVTQWYHDHRMDFTGRNVWNGLVGMFILDDPVDAALPLPRGEFDRPLILVDRTFDASNQIPYTFNINGNVGNTVLVNGVPQPYYDVGDRKYRFRILNASNRRPWTLRLSNGQPMTQIGTDSGLLPAPVQRPQITVFPSERVEVVIDFAGRLGEQIVLENVAQGGGGGGGGGGGDGQPIPEVMQFRVTRDLTETSSVPGTLRPTPTFPAPDRRRNFELELNNGLWTINDRLFDTNFVMADPKLNSTEEWTYFNTSPQPHALHIHDVDWRLTERFQVAVDAAGNPVRDANGVPVRGQAMPVQPFENALKEIWQIPPGQGFSVRTTFTDHVGLYIFHCHMLEHEDMAMMANFEVQPA